MSSKRPQLRDNSDLKVAVERELDWAAEGRNDRVGVSINDGAVTLSGQVESYPEKAAAVDAALRVRGVTAIADEIEVRHSRGIREDADIAREAAAALRNGGADATGHYVDITDLDAVREFVAR